MGLIGICSWGIERWCDDVVVRWCVVSSQAVLLLNETQNRNEK